MVSATGTYLDMPDDAVLRVAPGPADPSELAAADPHAAGRRPDLRARMGAAAAAHVRRDPRRRRRPPRATSMRSSARSGSSATPPARRWRSGASRSSTWASPRRWWPTGYGMEYARALGSFKRIAIEPRGASRGPLLDSSAAASLTSGSHRTDRAPTRRSRHRHRARHRTHVRGAEPAAGARLRELWAYREILLNLVRKELKVKYTASVLGALWSVLNPIVFLAVFSFVVKVLGNRIPRLPGLPALGPARVEPVLASLLQGSRSVIDNAQPREEGGVPARDPAAVGGRGRARRLRAAVGRAAGVHRWRSGHGFHAEACCCTRSSIVDAAGASRPR